jgi:hypothetical protein
MKALLALGLIVSTCAFAGDRDKDNGVVHEHYMKSDSGEIVLSDDACPEKNKFGFDKVAYATEKKEDGTSILHQGCWSVDPDNTAVSIWFYNESPGIVATYATRYFAKRELQSL